MPTYDNKDILNRVVKRLNEINTQSVLGELKQQQREKIIRVTGEELGKSVADNRSVKESNVFEIVTHVLKNNYISLLQHTVREAVKWIINMFEKVSEGISEYKDSKDYEDLYV